MTGKRFLLACLLCALLLPLQINAYTRTDEEEFEGSGDEVEDTTYFPTDDEDLDDDEFSGSGGGIIVDKIVNENTDEITGEPEVNDHKSPEVIKEEKVVVDPPKIRNKKPEVDLVEIDIEIDVEEKDEVEDDDDNDDDNNDTPVVKKSSTGLLDSKHFMAAVIIGGCIGLLCTIAVIMLLVYRMRKKDEGSYALDDKNTNFEYTKGISKEYHV